MWSAPDKNKNDKKNDTKENDTTKAVITEEPGAVYAAAEGTVKDIEASTDPTFANKVLGDGVVIFPETEPLWHHVRQPYHSYIQPDMQSDLQLQMEQRS